MGKSWSSLLSSLLGFLETTAEANMSSSPPSVLKPALSIWSTRSLS